MENGLQITLERFALLMADKMVDGASGCTMIMREKDP